MCVPVHALVIVIHKILLREKSKEEKKKEKFEDSKGVTRSHKSNDRQYNGQKNKEWSIKHDPEKVRIVQHELH